jgi:hypothetical protein
MGLDMYLIDNEGKELAYWRKANHIHSWFVVNVQHGIDDHCSHEVRLDQLKTLLEICKDVKEHSELIAIKMKTGTKSIEGEEIDITEDYMVIKDPSYAEKHLPTMEGFFFGSTDYDEKYSSDIDETIEQLENIISEYESHDMTGYQIYYYAWW